MSAEKKYTVLFTPTEEHFVHFLSVLSQRLPVDIHPILVYSSKATNTSQQLITWVWSPAQYPRPLPLSKKIFEFQKSQAMVSLMAKGT